MNRRGPVLALSARTVIAVGFTAISSVAFAQDANHLVKYDDANLTPSALTEQNGVLSYVGDSSLQLRMAGGSTSCVMGQDDEGAFVASDTAGAALRFMTRSNGGAQVETGRGLSEGGIVFTPDPASSGEACFIPESRDPVRAFLTQGGDQMHFRLSRAPCDLSNPGPDCDLSNPIAQNLFIAPYRYGMAIEYPSTIEVWSHDFSVHNDHNGCLLGYGGCFDAAEFWVGDETDSGGLFVTAHDRHSHVAPSDTSYVLISADTFGHQSHGSLYFQVRSSSDAFAFRVGSPNNEKTVATIDGSGAANLAAAHTAGSESSTLVASNDAGYMAGDVLIVDIDSDRSVSISTDAYSSLVAGVYGSDLGIITGTASDANDVPLVTTGIAVCNVSAENGPIARGDLLVTSGTPGYAMKGTDSTRMLGAVVGKALQPLNGGLGAIQILVTLR